MTARPVRVLMAMAFAAGLLLLHGPADAVDGVIEINQARALKGGVTPGDEPGFPITISQPGSYRLTSDILVPSTANGIELVAVDDVTIDLNGFSISGGRRAISGGASNNIAVIAGTVRGTTKAGILLGPSARVENIRLHGTQDTGIGVGVGSRVVGCIVSDTGYGIIAGSASVVTGNTASSNRYSGIVMNGGSVGGSTVSGNTASDNGENGIDILGGATLIGNTVDGNGASGIVCSGRCVVTSNAVTSNRSVGLSLEGRSGYGGNVLGNNNGGDAQPQLAAPLAFQLSPNVCGGALCP